MDGPSHSHPHPYKDVDIAIARQNLLLKYVQQIQNMYTSAALWEIFELICSPQSNDLDHMNNLANDRTFLFG